MNDGNQIFKHPVNVTPRMLEDLPDDAPVEGLRRALTEVANIAGEVVSHRAAVLADTRSELNAAGQARKIHEHGLPALVGADTILEAAIEKADNAIEKIERDLAKGLPPLEETGNAVEIRAHVKGLGKAERRKFVADAQAGGDTATLAAILGAPAYLSGVTDAELAVVSEVRNRTAAKANPKLARQLETLKTARLRVDMARTSLDAARVRAFGVGLPAVAA